MKFFKNLNINDVSIESEADNFDRIIENRVSGLKSIGKDEFMIWAKMNNIDERIARTFLDFNKKSVNEIPEIQDKISLGDKTYRKDMITPNELEKIKKSKKKYLEK